jgi:hypothetical protein
LKNWKIIILATLAVVAAALLVSTEAVLGPFVFNPNTGYEELMSRGDMMRGYGYNVPYTYAGTTLSITDTNTIAQKYVTSIGNTNLAGKQIQEYTNNFYILVNDKTTGNGAFELLINKCTGRIYSEMGPNMMWNTQNEMMRSSILGGIY